METVGVPAGGLESVTGMLNVPALSLTVSLPVLKLTDDNRRRSSRASNDALRWNARERLRRAPVWVRRRRECRKEENQDARVMGHSSVDEARGVMVRRKMERPRLRDKVPRCGLVQRDVGCPAHAALSSARVVRGRRALAEPSLALLLRKTVRETPADLLTDSRFLAGFLAKVRSFLALLVREGTRHHAV